MVVSNVSNISGYSSATRSGSTGRAPATEDPRAGEDNKGFWPLDKLVKAYTTYLDSKQLEIQEQQTARRYRHGAQWTSDQIKVFNDRKQPVVTYNKIGPKVDGIVGTIERLKQDPKAFPRTPEHQAGADLATAVLRYMMDNNNWNAISPLVSEAAAVDGLGGIELDLKAVQVTPQAQHGVPHQEPDYDVMFSPVDNDGFFYDPRSFKHDFSDARYLGMGKFVDEEQLVEMLPGMEDDIKAACDGNTELMSNSDRDNRWFATNGDFRQVRLVDVWYRSKGGWKWALFTGSKILMQGVSPFVNEHDEAISKYIMFSACVDHDGDRYGFPRNLMSPQDEVNQRRSKGLHELNNRRIIATKGAIADTNVEAIRREAARADGIVLVNTSLQDVTFDDAAKQAAVMGQLEFMKSAAQEIENFGPNSAMIGGDAATGGGSSGRAIALLQQAGLAGLGPYMFNLRGWKMRVYRALFCAAQKYWTNQRWIRVTDAEGEPQFVQINEMMNGPDGQPLGMMRNAIGELDVDIILDEGPDTITLMQDTYEAISQALPSVAPMLSPGQATAVMQVLIETSPLPADVKKKFRDAGEQEAGQPDPKMQEAQAKMAMQQAETQAKMALEREKAQADNTHKQQAAMLDLEIERNRSSNDIQIEREKASAQMEIEKFKAQQQTQLAIAQAQIKAQQEQEHQQALRQQAFDFEAPKREAEATKSSKMDEALATLVNTIGQSHQGLMAAMSKPRKATIHRDPRTGKVLGAALVTED